MVFLYSRSRYLQVFTLFYRVSVGIILSQSDTFFLGQRQKWPNTPISQRVRRGCCKVLYKCRMYCCSLLPMLPHVACCRWQKRSWTLELARHIRRERVSHSQRGFCDVVSARQSKPLIGGGRLVATVATVAAAAKGWQTNSRRLADEAREWGRERREGERGLASDGHFVFISKMLHELIYLFLISGQHHTSACCHFSCLCSFRSSCSDCSWVISICCWSYQL